MPRSRLDKLLVARGLAPSEEKAQALILTGDVLVANVPITKSGTMIDDRVEIRIRGERSRFVGRGGDKLESVFKAFDVQISGKVVIDVGSSTGGFTDCVLQRGAALVYAVDVGTNQLDYKLRVDARVVVMEQTHVKDLRREMFTPTPQLAVVDVSFISLAKILDYVVQLLEPQSEIICLVKPQFELDAELVEQGGVVRNPEHQQLAVQNVLTRARELGLAELGVVPSELKGEKSGNQEYFLWLKMGPK